MEKKRIQQLFRNHMKGLGFNCRGNYSHKFLDDDYLIGVFLDHHSYAKAYYVEFGVIYEPDEKRLPFSGWCDWDARFLFTANQEEDLEQYPIEILKLKAKGKLIDWFEYDVRSENEFITQLQINIEKRLSLLYDKEYVLNLYRENWVLFRMIPYETVYKIARLAGIDADEAIAFRDSRRKMY